MTLIEFIFNAFLLLHPFSFLLMIRKEFLQFAILPTERRGGMLNCAFRAFNDTDVADWLSDLRSSPSWTGTCSSRPPGTRRCSPGRPHPGSARRCSLANRWAPESWGPRRTWRPSAEQGRARRRSGTAGWTASTPHPAAPTRPARSRMRAGVRSRWDRWSSSEELLSEVLVRVEGACPPPPPRCRVSASAEMCSWSRNKARRRSLRRAMPLDSCFSGFPLTPPGRSGFAVLCRAESLSGRALGEGLSFELKEHPEGHEGRTSYLHTERSRTTDWI